MLAKLKDVLHLGKSSDAQDRNSSVCLLDPTTNLPKDTSHGIWPFGKAPVVQVAETSFDFGQVSEEGSFVHDFRVKNTGAGILKIKDIRPG